MMSWGRVGLAAVLALAATDALAEDALADDAFADNRGIFQVAQAGQQQLAIPVSPPPSGQMLQVRNSACGRITLSFNNPSLCKQGTCTVQLDRAAFANLPVDLSYAERDVQIAVAGTCDDDPNARIAGQCGVSLAPFYGQPARSDSVPGASDYLTPDDGTGVLNQQGPRGSGTEGEPDPSLQIMNLPRNRIVIGSNPGLAPQGFASAVNVSIATGACERDSPNGPRRCNAACGR